MYKTNTPATTLRTVTNFEDFAALAAEVKATKAPLFYILDVQVWGDTTAEEDIFAFSDKFYIDDMAEEDGGPVIRCDCFAPITFRYCYATFDEAYQAMQKLVGRADIFGFDILSCPAGRFQMDVRRYLEFWKFDADGRELDRSVSSNVLEPYYYPGNLYLGRTEAQQKFAPGDVVQVTWAADAQPAEACYQTLGVVVAVPDTQRQCFDKADWVLTDRGLQPTDNEAYSPNRYYTVAFPKADGGSAIHPFVDPLDLRTPALEVSADLQQLLDACRPKAASTVDE